MEKELSREDYNNLSEEVRSVSSVFSKPFTINVCDQCGYPVLSLGYSFLNCLPPGILRASRHWTEHPVRRDMVVVNRTMCAECEPIQKERLWWDG